MRSKDRETYRYLSVGFPAIDDDIGVLKYAWLDFSIKITSKVKRSFILCVLHIHKFQVSNQEQAAENYSALIKTVYPHILPCRITTMGRCLQTTQVSQFVQPISQNVRTPLWSADHTGTYALHRDTRQDQVTNMAPKQTELFEVQACPMDELHPWHNLLEMFNKTIFLKG
eukprot:IDg5185t1